MRVLKFGGTSVGSPETIEKVISIVQQALAKEKVAVVVSAFGGITDKLIQTGETAAAGDQHYRELYKQIEDRHIQAVKTLVHARRQSGVIASAKYLLNELEDILQGVFLVKEMSPKILDFILSFGERLSASIITEAFKERGTDARYKDSRELIITNAAFGNAQVDFGQTDQLIQQFFIGAQGELQVLPGFIASTTRQETTTLGRGGSDYTASIIAAALNVDFLEIWTDVNGMMTADPRKVKAAFTIPEISYEEAMELSYFGAKVIYPPSIQPAYRKQIPILVKNTFEATHPGTIISHNAKPGEKPVRGISSMKSVALLTLSGSGMVGVTGTARRLFGCLANQHVNVILISQASSEHSISIAIASGSVARAEAAIRLEFAAEFENGDIEDVLIEQELVVMAVVGNKMKNRPGVSGKLLSAIGRNGINVLAIAQGASELNISFVVYQRDEEKALNVIHEGFFLSETKVLHLFVAGPNGQIGQTLLKQVANQFENLKKYQGIEIRLNGLLNSRQMLANPAGISLENPVKLLEAQGEKADLPGFTEQIKQLNLPSSVFVDCTANEQVTGQYAALLDASVSVVTPNKLACSGDHNTYTRLKHIAQKRNIRFLYETNVAAGLPVISTLNDLVQSGDKVLKVEAILSGTLNYIFNTVSAEKSLSNVVREAMKKGLTEPDPRVDLSGADVARKILILARELGYELSLKDVEMKPFLPAEVLNAEDVEGFLSRLGDYDQQFEQQRAELDPGGEKFRVIARFEEGRATVDLERFDQTHPFYTAAGSDNIVLFTTKRYFEQPLMIKGPGAGAEVTAAGVFADIIRIAW